MSLLCDMDRVGPYEIVEPIGQGAMGAVYLARDSRLSRRVAIKVISVEDEADGSRQRRFVQEARAASALNHPNIVTVHDFGTENGLSYIVTELVEGESLRKIISRSAVPIRKLLEIAIQIADALAAAHAAGIVHRDLKPENIMITPGGRVKLLDFGLAKPLVPADSGQTSDENATVPGVLLGTVAYMSPEQTRGAPASLQSDQFALGVMLHEMATGHHPFLRETPMETLIAIANSGRAPFTPGPVAFRLLVDRCLAKDPAARFESTEEISERLRKISNQLPGLSPVRGTRPRWWKQVSPQMVSAAVIGAELGCVGLFALGLFSASRLLSPRVRDPLTFDFVPFATERGLELFPAWSPNLRVIAYSAEQKGVLQIFTRSTESAIPTQVTRSAADCMFPFWSQDGARLYYIAEHNGRPALWSVNIAGGAPEAELDNVAQAALSPDGRMLALLRPETGGAAYSLWTASPPASAPHRLQAPGFDPGPLAPWSYLRFAPDSSALAVWAARLDGNSAFWLIPRDGTAPARLFPRLGANRLAQGFSWLPDSQRILFAESAPLSSAAHLWIGTTRSGELSEITNGPAREEFPSASPSGLDAAFNLIDARYELRNISLGSGGAPVVTPSTTGNTLAPAWSPDGRQLAYVTDRAGSPEIRIRSADGAWERTAAGAGDFEDATYAFLNVAFSPNGQSIAYTRMGGEGEQIWISAISGGPPHRIANDQTARKRGLSWSPDGNWLAYATVRDGHSVLMRASVGSDEAETVCRDCGAFPAWSPRGGEIAAVNGAAGILLAAADGSSVRPVGWGQWLALAWTKRGSSILGIARTDEGGVALVELAPRDGTQSVIHQLGPWPAAFSFGLATGMDPVRGISITADQRTVTYAALNVSSDVWLLKGLNEPGLLGRWRR